MSDNITPRDQLLKLAEVAGRRHDHVLTELLEQLYFDPDERDGQSVALLAQQFLREIKLHQREPDPFGPAPPTEVLRSGDIIIGTLNHYSERVRIPFSGHKYICGTTQTGKTTLTKIIVLSAHKMGKRVIIFDPEGQFSRDLLGVFAPNDVYFVEPSSYLVNPYQPPTGMGEREWLSYMSLLDAEIWFYKKGTENVTNNAAISLLNAGQPLTLKSLFSRIVSCEPRRYEAQFEPWSRVKETLESLLNYFPNLAVARSRGLAEIFSRPVVIFDWSSLNDHRHKKYMTLHPLLWLLASRTGRYDLGTDTMIVFDEVSQLASTELARTSETESIFETILRRSAKRGISVVTIDQDPAFTHPVVRANSELKIIMRLDEGRDMQTIAADFCLTPEQRAYLNMLQPRQAIVKLPVFPPFLVNIPEVAHADPAR